MGQIIQEPIHCSSAEEFLDALSPTGEYFRDYDLDAPFLFRGQGQDWPLIPSLFRKNNTLKNLTNRNIEDYAQLRLAERDLLIQFFRIADKRGLVLPDDSQELRTFFAGLASDDTGVSSNIGGSKVENFGLAVMALAQHYGVPTRLLDWTLLPFIAAFFAGYDAYNHAGVLNSTSHLVVWSFYFPSFEREVHYGKDSYVIRSVTAPSATNENLKAQQGVFTLVNSFYTNEIEGKYLPFSDIVERSPQKIVAKLRKFTLPVSEASKLLYFLAKLDVTPSAVYPGYESVVLDLRMQRNWKTH